MLEIDLKEKFTSVHFEEVISKYWKSSLEEKNIEFNLTKLEWIAIEQITFLVSWINELTDLNKKVSVLLPSSRDIRTTVNGKVREFSKNQEYMAHGLNQQGLVLFALVWLISKYLLYL